MKKIFTTLFLALYGLAGFGQSFKVDTLYKSGPDSNRINIVILGDGFTKEQMPDFLAEARKFATFFLSYDPYNRYKDYFNVFAISTPSEESGVTNPGTAPDAYPEQPVGIKKTFYSGTFGTSIHRLVTVNFAKAFGVLASNVPQYDLAIMLVNTTYYGGSGGSIAVHTLNEAANLIGVHEIGHSFTALNDEYWAGPGYGWEAPNMTADGDESTIRWRNWLRSNGIGIHKHSGNGDAANWHKPTNAACLMEYLDKRFCAVCREATTEKILSLVNPIENSSPPTSQKITVSKPATFRIDLLKPSPNSLKVEWRLDDELVGSGKDEMTLSPEDFGGDAVLTASVFDSTAISRKDDAANGRTQYVQWNVASTKPAVFTIKAANDSICAGSSTTLTAKGCPGTVSWSTNQTGSTIDVSPAASAKYTATCRVSGNVTGNAFVSVTILEVPAATASNDGPYLVGETITLKASEGQDFEWTGPGNFKASTREFTIHDAQLVNAGKYGVKVTYKNGCNAAAETEVVVDPVLGAEPAGEWVRLSPNPASDHVNVSTSFAGNSVITLFDIFGKKLKSVRFEKEATVDLKGIRGAVVYRVVNAAQEEFSGKIWVP